MGALERELATFTVDESQRRLLLAPMTARMRALAHELAEAYGLATSSVGCALAWRLHGAPCAQEQERVEAESERQAAPLRAARSVAGGASLFSSHAPPSSAPPTSPFLPRSALFPPRNAPPHRCAADSSRVLRRTLTPSLLSHALRPAAPHRAHARWRSREPHRRTQPLPTRAHTLCHPHTHTQARAQPPHPAHQDPGVWAAPPVARGGGHRHVPAGAGGAAAERLQRHRGRQAAAAGHCAWDQRGSLLPRVVGCVRARGGRKGGEGQRGGVGMAVAQSFCDGEVGACARGTQGAWGSE